MPVTKCATSRMGASRLMCSRRVMSSSEAARPKSSSVACGSDDTCRAPRAGRTFCDCLLVHLQRDACTDDKAPVQTPPVRRRLQGMQMLSSCNAHHMSSCLASSCLQKASSALPSAMSALQHVSACHAACACRHVQARTYRVGLSICSSPGAGTCCSLHSMDIIVMTSNLNDRRAVACTWASSDSVLAVRIRLAPS